VQLGLRIVRRIVRRVVLRRRVRRRLRRVRRVSGRAPDRVGLGWRSELAAGILANLDRIDVVEVIADDYLDAPGRVRSLQTLGAQVPIVLHGVGLGLASASPVDRRRLDRMAALVDRVQPEAWSEHLAFVRADGVEIGHLAAPPRTEATIEGTCRNLDAARRAVGSLPYLENIATLIDPPASRMSEPTWIAGVLGGSGGQLLLDLHNLHANATNFGWRAEELFGAVDPARIACIHIAGGRRLRGDRILDDHLHPVPDAVFALLTEVARRAAQPLTVILERDGHYPPIGDLLAELDMARQAVERGRLRRAEVRL
jgi:uncharacterized protein (UPF0276 family)